MSQPALVRSFGASAIRVSRLDEDGSPAFATDLGSAYNMRPIRVNREPQTTTGDRFEQKDGSGVICAVKQNRDQVTGETLTLELCEFDMETIEIMSGASIIFNPLVPTQAIGVKAPDPTDEPAPVEFNAWSEARLADGPFGAFPYLHWVWPFTKWTVSSSSLEAGFLAVSLTGTAESNSEIGTGSFGDFPEELDRFWNAFLANDLPDPTVAPYNEFGLQGGYIDTPDS